jgi:predicted molibdopterin-dependent oxidoreductase YjgC
VSWIVAARRSGKVSLLIVQGVVTTDLTTAADIVLPGAAWVEKDAIYTNEQGFVQASSKVINPPGEAREDWQILANIAASLGLTMPYRCRRPIGCRRRTRRNGGSGISCIRTCRR